MSLHHSGPSSRVLIVAHQVVVLCLRYLIQNLTKAEILQIDREGQIANCGVTEYRLRTSPKSLTTNDAGLQLARHNFLACLQQSGAAETSRPDTPAGPR